MKFTDTNIIDLLLVIALTIALFATLYIGDVSISNSIVAGFLGYLGAKHSNNDTKPAVKQVEQKEDTK